MRLVACWWLVVGSIVMGVLSWLASAGVGQAAVQVGRGASTLTPLGSGGTRALHCRPACHTSRVVGALEPRPHVLVPETYALNAGVHARRFGRTLARLDSLFLDAATELGSKPWAEGMWGGVEVSR